MRDEARDAHLAWSDKQRRILSANGKAESFYLTDRGFPFEDSELPHSLLLSGIDTRSEFRRWKREARKLPHPIVGVWTRPLFYGGWEHSTDQDEIVYNIQAGSLFIDLRIPRSKRHVLGKCDSVDSLDKLDAMQLSLYARQHIFAGYSQIEYNKSKLPYEYFCTRHHCIDWNFVGIGRTRPNKWWIEMHDSKALWKEWSYATDDAGQHYYCERWELHEKGTPGPVVALRKSSGVDGVLVVVGDHFNYCINRSIEDTPTAVNSKISSLVDLVDTLLLQGEFEAARRWLGIDGGHGRVSSGWVLDCCIQFWKEGKPLWAEADIDVHGDDFDTCHVTWLGEKWEIFECNLPNVSDLRRLLMTGVSSQNLDYSNMP